MFGLNEANPHTPTPKVPSRKLPPLKTKKMDLDYDVLPTKSLDNIKKDSSFISDSTKEKHTVHGEETPFGKRGSQDTHSPDSPDRRSPDASPRKPGEDALPGDGNVDDPFAVKVKEVPKWKKRVQKILDNTVFNVIIGFFIFFTLFGSDIKVLASDNSSDFAFDIVNIICMVGFSIEIVCNVLVTPGYNWSFFFYLDIISTISLILDINLISGELLPAKAGKSAAVARASRASRIGTKAGRVVRIIRLVRLAKLYKQMAKKEEEAKKKKEETKIHPEGAEDPKTEPTEAASPDMPKKRALKRKKAQVKVGEDNPFLDELNIKESRVGKKLSDMTTKRLIVMILLLLIIVPLCDSGFYYSDPDSLTFEVGLLAYLYNDTAITNITLINNHRDYIVQHEITQNPPIIYLEVPGINYYWTAPDTDLTTFRDSETNDAYSDPINYGTIHGISNQKPDNTIESGLGIGKTIFIALCLVVGSMMFSKDANELVLTPLERMILKVQRIAKNPMVAKDEKIIKEGAGTNETVDIENAIIKIGGLLALGFGDAGSEIVAANMAAGGDINPMLPGKKKMAIFGFCDIRNFTDATEVLQEEVMIFVNSIGGIVHSVVDTFGGSANKNIGDAFLLAWKIPDAELVDPKDVTKGVKQTKIINNYADYALMAFLKIQAKINRNPVILAYRKHKKLNERLENYRVRMGFGLHVGWAIEGAIGSYFKIDASYLSPNVNMASRFEAATKQYGVPLLFSGDLYDLFSPETKDKCRLIDIITVKGSIKPVRIYTVDMDSEGFEQTKDRSHLTAEEKRLRQRSKRLDHLELLNSGEGATLWETDKELIHLTRFHNPVFMKKFKDAFDQYVAGDWRKCKEGLEEVLKLNPGDGPTKTLMDVLEESQFIAPNDWKGYRVLTEK